jgi:predicted PurR-regulated permease PerM
MSRLVSLIVLLVVLAVVAFLFFQVMAGFFVPLFLALILVVLFRPVHRWFLSRVRNNKHVAAGLTTAAIMLVVFAPLGIVMVQAAREGASFINHRNATSSTNATANSQAAPAAAGPQSSDLANSRDEQAAESDPTAIVRQLIARAVESLDLPITVERQHELARDLINQVESFLKPLLFGGAQFVGNTLLGLLVLIVALYFFLLDGAPMIDSVMELVPLDACHKQELVARFVSVSRAIVTATLLSAVAQGLLAGIAYWIAGLPAVFLLTALTMLLSLVPFVGAISVWVPCALWLYFHDHTAAAIGLSVYGGVIVSQADNIIKPYVLHGQSNLHPLLALLSVLGGVQALGPIGIVVGPMAVAFLQTLLNMLRVELRHFDDQTSPPALELPSGVDSKEPLR